MTVETDETRPQPAGELADKTQHANTKKKDDRSKRAPDLLEGHKESSESSVDDSDGGRAAEDQEPSGDNASDFSAEFNSEDEPEDEDDFDGADYDSDEVKPRGGSSTYNLRASGVKRKLASENGNGEVSSDDGEGPSLRTRQRTGRASTVEYFESDEEEEEDDDDDNETDNSS